jgi:hypothetical protein
MNPKRGRKSRATENKAWMEAKNEHLRSSIAQPHLSPDEKGSRQANRQRAIQENMEEND